MAVGFSNTNKPINPRGLDASPKGYNRAALYSGKALDFDGVNDYLSSGAFSLDTSEWSASMILKNDSAPSDTIFFSFSATGSNDESFIFYNNFANSNKISFYGAAFTGSPVNFDYVIPTDYEHLTFTFASNTISLYVNGVFVDSGSVTGNDGTQTASAIVGARKQASYGQYFNGQVSGVKMYSTALTAAQVSDLYNNPEKIVPTGVADTALKLWLPMMEGAGTTAYDGSGNGNHGTISGATYVNGVGAPVAQSAVIDWNKGTNYQTYSEEFTIAWALYGVSISTDQTTAPDGLNTADLYDDGTGTGTHLVEKTCANLSSAVGISGFLYAKYIDAQYLVLGTYDTGYHFAVYDIQNGTLGSKMGGVTSSIEAAGNGFYKCSFTYSANTRINPYISFSLRDDDTANYFSGTGTNRQAYIWGASMRPTTDGDAYVKTDATAQTSPVLLPQGLTSGRDITGVNLFENVRKQGALNLDGNSWAEVHDNASLDITSAITLEAWVYWDGVANGDGILGRWDTTNNKKSYLLFNTNTRFRFYVSSDGNNAINQQNNTDISSGWNHIVGVYDGTKIYTYLNGAVDGSQNYSSGLDANDASIQIGLYNSNTATAYPNDIAQPRIYNRALTASEVLRNYNSGKSTYQ